MNATSMGSFRELTADEYLLMLDDVQMIVQPYALAKLEILSCSIPVFEYDMAVGPSSFTSRYDAETQAMLDEIDRLCAEVVTQHLKHQGYMLPACEP